MSFHITDGQRNARRGFIALLLLLQSHMKMRWITPAFHCLLPSDFRSACHHHNIQARSLCLGLSVLNGWQPQDSCSSLWIMHNVHSGLKSSAYPQQKFFSAQPHPSRWTVSALTQWCLWSSKNWKPLSYLCLSHSLAIIYIFISPFIF